MTRAKFGIGDKKYDNNTAHRLFLKKTCWNTNWIKGSFRNPIIETSSANSWLFLILNRQWEVLRTLLEKVWPKIGKQADRHSGGHPDRWIYGQTFLMLNCHPTYMERLKKIILANHITSSFILQEISSIGKWFSQAWIQFSKHSTCRTEKVINLIKVWELTSLIPCETNKISEYLFKASIKNYRIN